MKRAFVTSLLAALPLLGVFGAATPACMAWDAWNSCCSTCRDNRCYRWCDAVCNFRLVDECTHCAWRRTWYGPNALATPLRQYYIPRPPECSDCDGYAAGYVLENFPAESGHVVVSTVVSPEAAAGFSPARFERLGQIPNELDVVGAIPAPGRASTPAR
jgi:hypothetical protein